MNHHVCCTLETDITLCVNCTKNKQTNKTTTTVFWSNVKLKATYGMVPSTEFFILSRYSYQLDENNCLLSSCKEYFLSFFFYIMLSPNLSHTHD